MNKVHLDVNLLENLMRNLENGKKSVDFMRRFILENNNNDYKSLLDHHCMVALDTFDICLSQLKNFHFDLMIPKLEDPFFESRKCYKKRKIDDSREEEVEHLIDDGYVWRKYGQKLIMNSPHPRHYYRCTNKHDQKCQATKQVQQISNYPIKYKIIYNGNHSCNNSSPFIIDSPEEHSSGIVLSFDNSNQLRVVKIDDSREEEVEHLIDDGYVWRKYGQKLIMNSPHPRHYYRCTNKHDQKCEATKQVQQISNYPIKYKIIYNGNHSCNNSSPFIIDSPEEHSSGIVLSFDNSNQVDPLMFPPLAFPGFASSSPSSENVSSSNPVYKQSEEILSFENNSSSATSYNFEQDFNTIMPDFTDLLPYF